MIKKSLTLGVLLLLFGSIVFSNVNSISTIQPYKKNSYISNKDGLDIHYIFNITENLSNIIFTQYNESAGEIAKGRAFGTKGERHAAKILEENMTKIGLYTYKEQLCNSEKYPDLTHELEIVDYYVKINNKTVDAYIAPVWIKNSENNNSLNFTYNYSGLKVIKPPLIPSLYVSSVKLINKLEPFVLILKDKAFYPDSPLNFLPFWNNFIFNYKVVNIIYRGVPVLYSYLWDRYLDYCKGIILYDFNKDTYDMNILKNINHIPFIYINGSNGAKILEDHKNTKIGFKLEQKLNTSVISYNVIGQLNATNKENDTIIIDCLYDSWWCQGTADSAIGMSMVLAIAKWFKENKITPKYNIKFIGFSGEEHGFVAGSRHYENLHKDEKIKYVIDLNQLGFWQNNSKLILNIISNNFCFLKNIWKIVKQSNYGKRVNSSEKARPIFMKDGGPSNSNPFAKNRNNCITVCFLKDSGWRYHHRDGLNHSEGDVLKYFDFEDVEITGEIILNIVKYLTLDR